MPNCAGVMKAIKRCPDHRVPGGLNESCQFVRQRGFANGIDAIDGHSDRVSAFFADNDRSEAVQDVVTHRHGLTGSV